MHTLDVLENGHWTVLEAVEGLPEADWTTPGVCGVWSVKDIIAHLTSYEHLLVDVLSTYGESTPFLERWAKDGAAFNDVEVARYKDTPVPALLAEYREVQAETIDYLIRIPDAKLRVRGALAWYGDAYDLEDFIVYTFYGHKREHAAQIAVYRDQLQLQSA